LCEFVIKFSLLEELDISFDDDDDDFDDDYFEGSLEEIGRCCPLLKSLNFRRMISCEYFEDAFAIAKTMSGLRHLTLKRIVLSNDQLLAILDGCPLLESLDMQKCPIFELSESLEKRCREQIKDLQLPRKRNQSYKKFLLLPRR
jgi:F-box/leucine-rich repeat protein 2/20